MSFKFVLFAVLTFALSVSFVGCKDYDDDIDALKNQINGLVTSSQLTEKVATLESAINTAKTAADAAKTAADAAKVVADNALAAAGPAADAAAKAAAEAAAAAVDAAAAKSEAIAAAEAKVAALKTELQAFIAEGLKGAVTPTELEAALAKMADQVTALETEIGNILGHRLTSLSVIPTTHVNGIAAIELITLQYTPQKYQAMASHVADPSAHTNRPVLDHVAVVGATAKYISTSNNEAYFHVSPSLGVTTNDIELPSFECIKSENTTRAATVTENSPIKPVSHEIVKNVLTVKFQKTVTGSIGTVGDAHGTNKKETFYMASLKAPIAKANYTAAEKAAYDKDKTKVYVNSEYVRIEESNKIPYLVNKKTDFSKTITNTFADETQIVEIIGKDGKPKKEEIYVHYHDSVCMYNSLATELIDVKWAYDEELDLKTLVKVCTSDVGATTHAGHKDLTNYADYGLAFRFTLAKAAYITLGGPEGNTNKTDQQQFAKIDAPFSGLMTSKVYEVSGVSATAVGREPIVRVELVDTKNGNALIAQRYLKVKWVKDTKERTIPFNYTDSIYYCGNYAGRIGTVEMNSVIYHGAKEGGMTKQEFHSAYTQFEGITGAGEGTVRVIKNTESGVDSYNLVWDLTHAAIVTKYPIWANQDVMTFSKVCYYKDPSGGYADLKITLTRTIYKPVFNLWGYDGRYWVNNNSWNIFNVNPIVYNTQESNPAWAANTTNNPTCNIYTDLLNGYVDDKGVKPITGAGGAIWYSDKERTGKKFYYSAFYPTTGGTNLGTKAGTYSEPGVRFVFDEVKLKNGDAAKYVYDYFNGTTTVQKRATVSADGTKLYIDNVLAAEIINYVDNTLNANEVVYNIRLNEANPTHAPRTGDNPTEAAKAIVGKNVPIKLVSNICGDVHAAPALTPHTVTIKEYDAFIIEPLTVKRGTTDNFVDATIGGSTIDVKNAFTYLSWNADASGNKYPVANTTGQPKALWEFYEVVAGQWMTDQIKSNLKLVDGNLVPSDVTNGPLPSNTSVVYDPATEKLTYNNYSGTPVNWDYKLYIPVKFGYKWKTFTMTFEVQVKKNAGTPAE